MAPVHRMTESEFLAEGERQYVASVRRAVEETFDAAAYRPVEETYGVLVRELRRRGVEPDPAAVYDGALLISRGRKPAVLRG